MAAEYPIKYTSDVANAVNGIDQLTAKLLALEVVVDRLKPKLKDIGKEAVPTLNAAAKAADKLGASAGALDAKATKAAGAVGGLGKAAVITSGQTTAAGNAASGLGTRLDATAAKATTTAAALTGLAAGANTAAPALTGAGQAARGVVPHMEGTASAVNLVTTRFLAMQAARAVLTAIMEETRKIEEHWQKVAQEASDFRDSLRELASLRGQPGPTDVITADALDLALRTRMAPQKAAELSAAYENIGPTVREKGHLKPTVGTPEQLEADILAETGKTARRLGIGTEEAGTGIGTAGLFHTFQTTGDAMEQFGGAMKGLQEGAVKYGAGLKALNVAAAKLVDTEEAAAEEAAPGTIGSFAEAGVTLGVLSLGTGGAAHKAGTRMVQISRALNPAEDKAQGIPAKALQDIGVAGKAVPDQLIQLGKFLKAQKIADPKKWLETNKIGTEATREAVVAGLKSADVLETRIRRTRESAKTGATGAATIAENRAFMAADKTAAAAGVDAVKAATDLAEGIEGPEVFEKAKQAAEERRRQQDPLAAYDQFANIVESESMLNPFAWLSKLESGVSVRAKEQEENTKYGAIPFLKKEAARVQADIGAELPGLESGNLKTRADAFARAARAVREKGGDPLGVGALTEEAQKRIAATRPAAPPVPAARPGAPLAPAGAGGVGPQAAAFGAGGPGAGLNQKTQDDQLKCLGRLVAIAERPRGLNGAGAATLGPLPFDDGDFGGRRS